MQLLPTQPLHDERQAMETGLTSNEADERLAEFGPNEPADGKRCIVVPCVVTLFVNPLVLILLIADIASAYRAAAAERRLNGDPIDAAVVLENVLASGLLGFWQEYSSRFATTD